MPELPEVETVCRELAPLLRRCELERVEIIDSKLRALKWRELVGMRVSSVFRRGKQVVMHFDGESPKFVAVHLRMTGSLIWVGKRSRVNSRSVMQHQASFGVDENKHCRLRFEFKQGILYFVDTRRFGTVELFSEIEQIRRPGLEPLEPTFTAEVLQQLTSRSKQNMKQFLLRQDRIVGIGNIYASEILFDAKIHPRREAGSLSLEECARVVKSTKKILERAIENAGTTISDFQRSSGEGGSFQNFLAVYDRAEKACRRCRSQIVRLVQQQRSTFFCATCQPLRSGGSRRRRDKKRSNASNEKKTQSSKSSKLR